MKRTPRVLAALAGLALLAACDTAKADNIGVVYSAGPASGREYVEATAQGAQVFTWNDDYYQVPLSTRTYVLDADDSAADVKVDISVPSSDQTLIDFKVAVSFAINTNTDDVKGIEGGSLRKFLEKVCFRYDCVNSDGVNDQGWDKMLAQTMKPALFTTFKDHTQDYTGPELVYNLTPPGGKIPAVDEAKIEIGPAFQKELVRLMGAEYFCGPTFVRNAPTHECPPIQLTITKVEYHNKDLQESREAKRVAEEKASATKVETEALAEQQRALDKALSNPTYVRYLESQNRLKAAQECAKSAKSCVLIIGGSANVNVPAGG